MSCDRQLSHGSRQPSGDGTRLAGRLGGLGGAILAHGIARADLEQRVADDPFVAEAVVIPEIIEVTPNLTDERLRFLVA